MAERTGVGPPPNLLGGRYRLGPRLGRGGMAEVYEAYDTRLQRAVAVKVLLADLAASEAARARFEAEARAAARLSHPNVVAVHDTGETAGAPWIVMELLPGETLGHRLAAGGAVGAGEAMRLAADVLSALDAAHGAGVVHRDVKPANILLQPDGSAKVADFGIAKALDPAGSDITTTAAVVGTPAYVAPERVEGAPASPASDLWSVGVVLYEALAGRRPFPGSSALAVAIGARSGPAVPLASARPDLPARLTASVDRALAPDPGERFATAAEMASALGITLRGGGRPARPPLGTPPPPGGLRHGEPPTEWMDLTIVEPLEEGEGPDEGGMGRRARWAVVALVVGLALAALGLSLAERPSSGRSPSGGASRVSGTGTASTAARTVGSSTTAVPATSSTSPAQPTTTSTSTSTTGAPPGPPAGGGGGGGNGHGHGHGHGGSGQGP
ncbi:MAG: serine/threonine-protein kinase [Acidimicrobiales bacterium]